MSGLTKKEMASAVLQALLDLKADGPACGVIGICANVDDLLAPKCGGDDLEMYWEDSRDVVFGGWDDPMASGCKAFPIKGNYMVGERAMWIEGEYAEARWRLVDHLIEHYTALAGE